MYNMGVFKDLYNVFSPLFNDNKKDVWIQRKNVSQLDLEVCNGEATEDKKTRTCWKCVALNRTVFRRKKLPDFFHDKCKCKHQILENIKISTIFPIKKIINYLFADNNKQAMMRSMGYVIDDSELIYTLIDDTVKEKFNSGDFELKSLDKHGQHITIRLMLDGARDHIGKKYACHIGCVVWPNGQIRIASPLIKD